MTVAHDRLRAEWDARERAAAAATGAGRAEMHAQMARIRARRAGQPEPWPEVAQPGAGLPDPTR